MIYLTVKTCYDDNDDDDKFVDAIGTVKNYIISSTVLVPLTSKFNRLLDPCWHDQTFAILFLESFETQIRYFRNMFFLNECYKLEITLNQGYLASGDHILFHKMVK